MNEYGEWKKAGYGSHKDRRPAETIGKIRGILNGMGILLSERKWEAFGEGSLSVTLSDLSVGGVATNGKGVSGEYALASGYAEFMERLQNGRLYTWRFGLMDEVRFRYPDQRDMSVSRCLEEGRDMGLTHPFLEVLAGKEGLLPCLPFFDCFAGGIKHFPVPVLYDGFSCTGMCGGNTPEEAIAQGICEIFERYAGQLIFGDDDTGFPTIPPGAIGNRQASRITASLSGAGYRVVVKDLTLGGRFPVLAVVLLNGEGTKMKVSVGSYATPGIALERCLTELCQGLSPSAMEASMTDIDFSEAEYETVQYASDREQRRYEQERWRTNQSGRYPSRILRHVPSRGSDFRTAFLDTQPDSEGVLAFLLTILRKEALKLFVRDVSFLGFPSYFVYIPTLSELPDWEERALAAAEASPPAETLLRLDNAGEEELRNVTAFFTKRAKNPLSPHTNFASFTGIHLRDSPLATFPRVILWAMFHHRHKEWKKAFDCLALAMRLNDYTALYRSAVKTLSAALRQGLPTPAQFYWLALYFKMKSEGCPEVEIESTLGHLYGPQLTRIMRQIVGDEERIFGSLAFPSCGDCGGCRIDGACDYENWKALVTKLNARMESEFPKQDALHRLFRRFSPTADA